MRPMQLEFERQLENLVLLGYPALSGRSEGAFRALFEPLRARVVEEQAAVAQEAGGAPSVLVVRKELVRPEAAMAVTTLGKGAGFTELTPRVSDDFGAITSVTLPAGPAYLALGIDTGAEYLNVAPEQALLSIQAAGRSPMTIEEGVAVVTQFPELLRKNACFSLPGSRGSDQRVPAIWISSGRPRLGWCWDRNPHTWLGSASCAGRFGAS